MHQNCQHQRHEEEFTSQINHYGNLSTIGRGPKTLHEGIATHLMTVTSRWRETLPPDPLDTVTRSV